MKLLPDSFSYPLWDVNNPDNIDSSALPLSKQTVDRLAEWADRYDSILNVDDPASSGFPIEDARRAFDHDGGKLWCEVAAELGATYSVSYHSVLQRRLLPVANQFA